jgi:hypothetical protein
MRRAHKAASAFQASELEHVTNEKSRPKAVST